MTMLFFLSSMFFLTQSAIAVPQQFTQQGRVIDGSGIPITGIHTITVRIYDSAAGGQMLWDESQQTLLNNGFYSAFGSIYPNKKYGNQNSYEKRNMPSIK